MRCIVSNERKTIKIEIKKKTNSRINLFYSNVVSLGTKRIEIAFVFGHKIS